MPAHTSVAYDASGRSSPWACTRASQLGVVDDGHEPLLRASVGNVWLPSSPERPPQPVTQAPVSGELEHLVARERRAAPAWRRQATTGGAGRGRSSGSRSPGCDDASCRPCIRWPEPSPRLFVPARTSGRFGGCRGPSTTQCAAVITQSAWISVPPQNCAWKVSATPGMSSPTWAGYSPGSAAVLRVTFAGSLSAATGPAATKVRRAAASERRCRRCDSRRASVAGPRLPP